MQPQMDLSFEIPYGVDRISLYNAKSIFVRPHRDCAEMLELLSLTLNPFIPTLYA